MMAMLKKSKIYIGVSLVASAITLFITFIVLCIKKKSVSKAMLAIAAVEGCIGTVLILSHLNDKDMLSPCRGIFKKNRSFEFFDDDDEGDTNSLVDLKLDEDDDISVDEGELKYKLNFEIPRDEEASEADFQP